jgi:O-antigen/teichoic acid export membrane protein
VILRQASARLLPPGTVTYAASKVLPGAAGLLAVVVFLRLAGAPAYGVYSVTLAVAVFSGNIAVGWLRQAALRFAGDEQAAFRCLPAWVTWASLAGAACCTAVVVPLVLGGTGAHVMLGAFFVAGAFGCQALVVTLLQARLSPRKVFQAETSRAVLQLAIPCLALLLLGPSPAVLLFAVALAVMLSVLPVRSELPAWSAVPGLGARGRDVRARERRVLRAWWSYGWPMSLWLSTATVLQLSDRVLIARWLGTGAAGAYAGLYDVVNGGFAICLFPVTMAAHPRISTLWNQGRGTESLAENSRALRVQLVIFVPLLAGAALFRDALAGLVLPAGPQDYAPLVIPILLGAFLWQLALTVHKRLELERRTRTMLLFLLVATVANLVANVVLIPVYGPVAAAWTTLGGAAVYLALCVAWRLRHRYVEVGHAR